MAIDHYATCPGGTGKKVKFCCADLVGELEKIQRMLQGEQRQACLDHVGRLAQKYPGRACLLSVMANLQSELGRVEESKRTVDEFMKLHPGNPVAIADTALMTASEQGASAGVPLLQQALATSGSQLSPQVYDAIGGLAQLLMVEGNYLAAIGHLTLMLRIQPEDETAGTLLGQVMSTKIVPTLFKEEPHFRDAPEGAPWEAEFEAAMDLARNTGWMEAAKRLTSLSERITDSPAIWHNLAVLRGWLADKAGAVAALRRLAALPAPQVISFDDAVEAEALAQLLDTEAGSDWVDELAVEYPINDINRVIEKLSSDKRFVPVPVEALRFEDVNEPRPRAVFELLDKPLPDSIANLGIDELPNLLTRLDIYGRQTDREARLEFGAFRTQMDQIASTLGEVLGDAIGPIGPQEVASHVTAGQLLLNWNWRLPRDVTAEQLQKLMLQKRRDVVLNRWPRMPQAVLEGKTAEQTVHEPRLRIRLMASVFLVEQSLDQPATENLVNELRGRLGLPIPDAIDPTGVYMGDVPLVRLARVVMSKLSDEDLLAVYRRAMLTSLRIVLRKCGTELVSRPSLDGKIDKAACYGLLANLADDPGQAIELLGKARAAATAAGQSCARWDMAEFEIRLHRGDVQESVELLRHLQTVHGKEPGVNQALMRFMMAAGLIGPDGRPTAPPQEGPGIVVPGSQAEPGKIWTPGSEAPAGKKSAIWTPGD